MVYQKIQSTSPVKQGLTEKVYWDQKNLRERASIEKQTCLKAAVEIILAYKDKLDLEQAIQKIEEVAIRLYTNVLYLQG